MMSAMNLPRYRSNWWQSLGCPWCQDLRSIYGRGCAGTLWSGGSARYGRVPRKPAVYDLLCRPKLACYDTVYDFARSEPQRGVTEVPSSVINELLTSVALSAWCSIPLHREFAPFFVAADASTDYGSEGCVAENHGSRGTQYRSFVLPGR